MNAQPSSAKQQCSVGSPNTKPAAADEMAMAVGGAFVDVTRNQGTMLLRREMTGNWQMAQLLQG